MPTVAPAHVYVPVPKTGSTYTHRALSRLGGRIYYGDPGPASAVPAEVKARRVTFATIRSPWQWYASWWAHCCRLRALDELTDTWGPSFPEALQTALEGGVEHPERPALLWPGELPGEGSLYSRAVRYLLQDGGQWQVAALIPTDRLGEGLAELGVIEERDAINVNPGGSEYARWYSDEMRAAVSERDAWIAELFGWWPFERSQSAVLWVGDA